MILPPEGDLAADEVHLPHSAEALVIERTHAVAVVLEPLSPRPQGFGVMQAQDLPYVER